MQEKFKTIEFDKRVPLPFDAVLYVESPTDESLNELVKMLVVNEGVTVKTMPQPFPLRFRYVSQGEMDAGKLEKGFENAGYNAEDAQEMADRLRSGILAEKGGCLALRLAPNFDEYGSPNDDNFILSMDVSPYNSREAFRDAMLQFAQEVAERNFLALAGMTYSFYLKEKNSSSSHYSVPPGQMGYIQIKTDTDAIDRKVDRRAREIIEHVATHYPDFDTSILINRSVKILGNTDKIRKVCPITVTKEGNILIEDPQGKMKKCDFGRGIIGRVLYVLFLRQLERAEQDPKIPPYIYRNKLNKHHDEMVKIYSEMAYRRGQTRDMEGMENSIENLWRKPTNEISHINAFFEDVFDEESLGGKYYTIRSLVQEDGEKLDAVGLETNDFDLGKYSIYWF